MPELPEVEVTRQGLQPHLQGRRVLACHWSGRRLRTPLPRKLLGDEIVNQEIGRVDRRAKYILIRMANRSVVLVHLGMTGRLGLFPATRARARHDHLWLRLDSGFELRFNDSRRFGSIQVWPGAQALQLEQAFHQAQGLEPLEREFTANALDTLAHNRKKPVKNFLMDNRLISGIGNIYANEILYQAHIHPLSPAGNLTKGQWDQVVHATRLVLHKAIQAGGTTIADFVSAAGKPGYFQLQLQVYGREGTPCPRCGQAIVKIRQAGRASWFCPGCQPTP